VWWGPNNDSMPAQKRFLSEVQQGRVPQTLWPYKEVGHTQDAKKELLSIVPYTNNVDVINTVKPTSLIRRVIQLGTPSDSKCVVLDFFAGSGTTIQSVLQQNADDGGRRSFLAVEMGNYFETTTKVRAIRSLSNPVWKDGSPIGDKHGSGIIKYQTLESYEDALNNLELSRTTAQGMLLDANAELREQYALSYMLDVESRGSQSLLNVKAFHDPDNYRLKIERGGVTQSVNVDLVETFNWLLGLIVKHIDLIRGVRVIDGTTPQGERVLVLWRNVGEMDGDRLDQWFERQGYNTRDLEYDVIYVNGDNNLENLRRPDQTWKVRLIEEEFQRLMFDVQEM